MRLRGVLVGAVVSLAAACTSSDPRALDSGEVRQLVVHGLEEAGQENALHFTTPEAECVADRVLDDVGDDRLEELGVDEGFGLSTLDFDADEQDQVFAALQGCVDLVGQVAATIDSDSGLEGDDARCVAERYVASDPFREAIFAERFDPALNERVDIALSEAAQACAVEDRPIPS